MKKQSVANSSHRKNQRGSVLAYTVLSVLALFFAVGLGADLSHLYLAKTELQNTADAGALAAATALRLAEGERRTEANLRAVNIVSQNKYNFNNNAFNAVEDVNCDDDSKVRTTFAVNLGGPYYCKGAVPDISTIRFVQVKTPSVPISIFFTAAILGSSRSLSATATAGFARVSSACVVSLDPDDEKALLVASQSKLTAQNCDIAVNSNSCEGSTAFAVESESTVTAGEISVTGCAYVPPPSIASPSPETSELPTADPLAYLTPPAVGPCNQTSAPYLVEGNVTLNPGVYCGGIKVSGSTTHATFSPGLYILNTGGLEVTSGSSAEGEGITFFNTAGYNLSEGDYPNDKYAPIKIFSNSTVDFSAPTAGEGNNPGNVPLQYLDVLFYQDRTKGHPAGCGTTIDCVDENIIQINNTVHLAGALYFPTQWLKLAASNSTAIVDGMVVARKIWVESGSEVTIRMGGEGGITEIPIVLYR